MPELSAEIVARTLDLLRAGPLPDESAHDAGIRREREIKAHLASLSPADAFGLRKRLQIDRDGDDLAIAFRRLNVERRDRLLAFLADPRRPFWVSES